MMANILAVISTAAAFPPQVWFSNRRAKYRRHNRGSSLFRPFELSSSSAAAENTKSNGSAEVASSSSPATVASASSPSPPCTLLPPPTSSQLALSSATGLGGLPLAVVPGLVVPHTRALQVSMLCEH